MGLSVITTLDQPPNLGAAWPISLITNCTYIYIYTERERERERERPGSSVGIATDYGLDGPGSNPGGDEIFRPSRPAPWPTQPPVK